MNTNIKGLYAEYVVAAEAARKGYLVGEMCQHSPYDLVIDRGNGPERVQVKYREKDKTGACLLSISRKNNSLNRVNYSSDNIDVIAIVEPEAGIAWLPISEIEGLQSINLRVERPKNGQVQGVRLFEDYTKW